MRWSLAFVLLWVTVAVSAQNGDKLAKRYGFDSNPAFYPQDTPKKALQSVVKAIESKRINYLLAQLADPQFVDEAVAEFKIQVPKGSDEAKTFLAFDRLVEETSAYFLDDPTILRELRVFAKEAQDEGKDESPFIGTAPSIQGRKVYLKKLEGRWFLENRQQ